MAEQNGYMLDTNVFNHILDGKFPMAALVGRALFVTHIQRDEIAKTKDADRRAALQRTFAEVLPGTHVTPSAVADVSVADGAAASSGGSIPTTSAAWGVSAWDEVAWSPEGDLLGALRRDLGKRNGEKKNNVQDALIAGPALRNGPILVTGEWQTDGRR